MFTGFLRLFGGRFVHKAVAGQAGEGRLLDFGLGFALLRDRRTPLRCKLAALLLGAAIMGAMIALELPMETVWGALMPLLGLAMDTLLDGMEVVIGPILLACLALPYLAPKPLAQRLREERAGLRLEKKTVE